MLIPLRESRWKSMYMAAPSATGVAAFLGGTWSVGFFQKRFNHTCFGDLRFTVRLRRFFHIKLWCVCWKDGGYNIHTWDLKLMASTAQPYWHGECERRLPYHGHLQAGLSFNGSAIDKLKYEQFASLFNANLILFITLRHHVKLSEREFASTLIALRCHKADWSGA